MLEHSMRFIPACTPHDLRWDLREVLACAVPVARPSSLERTLEDLVGDSLDSLWGRDDPSPRVGAPPATIVVLAAQSAVNEVLGETSGRDPLGASLRQLASGGALAIDRHRIVAFDDVRRAAIGWVGRAGACRSLLARLGLFARQSLPVLVRGETGTGKEIVARGIHRLGARRDKPFLALNCAELAASVLESELFGHVRGAFTGAAEDRVGLFEAAADGSVFLDEIGELPLAAQSKLLRVLEEHRVRRIGASTSRPLGCRIIAATNRDLADEVAHGRFRSDLYYRLRGCELTLAPLRERRDELLVLAATFVARASLRARRDAELAADARLALLAHGWPGNVRELRQTIDVAVLSATDARITAADLALGEPITSSAPPPEPLLTASAVERAHILRALASTAGNKMAAARLLGLSRQSLHRRMLRHGLAAPLALVAACERRNDDSRADDAAADGAQAR